MVISRRLRRRVYESLGFGRYSRPSLNGIDRRLEKYLTCENGFFVEAGANDGFAQSNTYYLERLRGWRGVLVEPIPRLYHACVRERPKSWVFNCALVSTDHDGSDVTMLNSGLMSVVEGARKSRAADLEHVQRGQELQGLEGYSEVAVPARTLTSILDEAGVEEIQFFSLDVEGYELSVLKGLDLQKYRPEYMLIETNFRDEIEAYLCDRYEAVDEFSHHDILYRRK